MVNTKIIFIASFISRIAAGCNLTGCPQVENYDMHCAFYQKEKKGYLDTMSHD